MQARKISLMVAGAALLCSGALAGCSGSSTLYEPSRINNKRVEVTTERYAKTVPASAVDSAFVTDLADHYTRFGDGPLSITVAYDPKAGNDSALNASKEAGRIAQALRESSVNTLKADILPVKGQGKEPDVLFTYQTYTAHAPKGCGTLPGVDNTMPNDTEDSDYQLGCSVEAMIARQISRPKDLLGRGGLEGPSDGRRGSNIIEVHRTGVPNEPIEGESASGNK